ncbi:hypothetical protein F511_18915 [Dorcoceras hygrometricum]|uniref:Uncharacterized protein n=1 Tax=Dorcoceras hygrometricum TaxID=472368 RepID=A0A2Z7DC84_9LAMI|nr:hypothetical protein F511_18915 [Dorcoceras hygrometricum]
MRCADLYIQAQQISPNYATSKPHETTAYCATNYALRPDFSRNRKDLTNNSDFSQNQISSQKLKNTKTSRIALYVKSDDRRSIWHENCPRSSEGGKDSLEALMNTVLLHTPDHRASLKVNS